jgi:hypothetical protein
MRYARCFAENLIGDNDWDAAAYLGADAHDIYFNVARTVGQ